MHSALGALFWGSYVRARLVLSSDVRTDVRACVTAYVRVYGLSGDDGSFLISRVLLCNFLFEAVNFEEFVFCSKEL